MCNYTNLRLSTHLIASHDMWRPLVYSGELSRWYPLGNTWFYMFQLWLVFFYLCSLPMITYQWDNPFVEKVWQTRICYLLEEDSLQGWNFTTKVNEEDIYHISLGLIKSIAMSEWTSYHLWFKWGHTQMLTSFMTIFHCS